MATQFGVCRWNSFRTRSPSFNPFENMYEADCAGIKRLYEKGLRDFSLLPMNSLRYPRRVKYSESNENFISSNKCKNVLLFDYSSKLNTNRNDTTEDEKERKSRPSSPENVFHQLDEFHAEEAKLLKQWNTRCCVSGGNHLSNANGLKARTYFNDLGYEIESFLQKKTTTLRSLLEHNNVR